MLGALWYFGEDKIRAYFEAPKTSEKSIENYNTLPAVVEAGVKMVEEPKEPEVSISDILQEDKKESHVVLPSQSDVIERVELASEEKASIQNDENIIGENLEEIIIKPKGEIWVGVVYLDSRDKKQFITRENITIDTSKDQLVRTGHGDFTISLNGENKVYFQQAPVRFKFIDGKLIQISANEFLELNGGKNW